MDRITTDAPQNPIPKPSIPDYELVRCIGQGSYGDVWLARAFAQSYRAVKIVYRDRFDDARPFERELEGIRKFDRISRGSPGLVDLLHVGQTPACFYYVMELADDAVSGQVINPDTYRPKTLTEVLSKQHRLTAGDSLDLGMTLAKALAFLHERQLVHRDVKPANVIFVNGQPKFADIGLVADMKDPKSFVGTEGFVPPEGPGTPVSDIYSLGKVLYEASLGEDRKSFPKLPSDIDQWPNWEQMRELNEVLLKACQNNPAQRYQTADDLYRDLAGLVNGKSIRRLRVLERRWGQFKRAALVSAMVLGLLGIGGYELFQERTRRQQNRAREIGALLGNGIQKMGSGELIQSLQPLVRTLALDTPDKHDVHRTRIGAILDQTPRLVQFWINDSPVRDAQFSADGKLLLFATATGRAHINDSRTGKELAPPFGSVQTMQTVSFSPDGKRVLLASEQDHTVSLWDWKASKRLDFRTYPASVMSARFDHAGQRIVTACADGIARVWNIADGRTLELRNHTGAVRFARFSPTDDRIVTCGVDNQALIWNAADGSLIGKPLLHGHWVVYASFSPDGTKVATASVDHQAHVWDLNTAKEIMPGLLHRDGVSAVEFSPDGQLLLTASWDMTARLWFSSSGRPFTPVPILPHSSRVLRVAFAPDGHRIATSCFDGTCRIWDLAGIMPEPQLLSAALCQDGTRLLTRSNQFLQVMDLRLGKAFPYIDADKPIAHAGLNRNGMFILLLSSKQELSILNAETGRIIASPPGVFKDLKSMRLSDDGKRLASWSENLLYTFDLRGGPSSPACFVHSNRITNVIFSPSGVQLLTLAGSEVRAYNLLTRERQFLLKHSTDVEQAEFSSDGRFVITACLNQQFTPCNAQIWDSSTGHARGEPIQHRDGICSASFSPNGRMVVTASEDFSALITDLDTRARSVPLPHNHQVRWAGFTPDSDWVLTVSRDRFGRLWEAKSGEPITPPLPLFADIFRGSCIQKRTFATTDEKGKVWIWKLQPAQHTSSDLFALAGLLNGNFRNLQGTAGDLNQRALDSWQVLRERYPSDFTVSKTKRIHWHEQQLNEAQREKNSFAASVQSGHLRSFGR